MPFYLPLFCPPALGSTQSPTPILPGVVPRQLGEKLKGLHCVEGRAGLGVQQSAPGQCLKQQQPSQPCWRTEPRFLRTERPSPQREEGGGEEEELLLPLASHTPDSSDERERDRSSRSAFDGISHLCPPDLWWSNPRNMPCNLGNKKSSAQWKIGPIGKKQI